MHSLRSSRDGLRDRGRESRNRGRGRFYFILIRCSLRPNYVRGRKPRGRAPAYTRMLLRPRGGKTRPQASARRQDRICPPADVTSLTLGGVSRARACYSLALSDLRFPFSQPPPFSVPDERTGKNSAVHSAGIPPTLHLARARFTFRATRRKSVLLEKREDRLPRPARARECFLESSR